MTELNGPKEPAAQPSPAWPRLNPGATQDPRVARALAVLEPLPGQPVEVHEAAYARLHDELHQALNEDPADGAA